MEVLSDQWEISSIFIGGQGEESILSQGTVGEKWKKSGMPGAKNYESKGRPETLANSWSLYAMLSPFRAKAI